MALMLDPSLLLYSYTTEEARESVRASSERVFVPSTFVGLISEKEFDDPVFRLLAPAAHVGVPARIEERTRWVLDEDLVAPWRPSPGLLDREELELPVRNAVLRSIRLEEWAFLQAESWLASRVRRPFDAFIKGGAVAIEFNRKVFDELATRTLKIPRVDDVPPALTQGQRLRAVTKWVAAGLVGTGVGSAIHPLLGAGIAETAYRLFALFDP